ncbi:MAG: hypothetical protein H7A25_25910 [Leptospiraceae bacterium]|nr:hypothetical protein [Leptospiraceae bacterium]
MEPPFPRDWWFKSSVKGSVERGYNGIAYIRLLSKRSASKYADGNSMEILSVEQEYRDELVYNFEVEDNHTYFVTENAVLVHNYDKENLSYNPETTFFEGIGERVNNLFSGKGFKTDNNLIEEDITAKGDFKGIKAEIDAKLKYQMPLTEAENDYLNKNKQISDLQSKENLSKEEKDKLKDLKDQLEAKELGHSLTMFERWKEEGRDEVPLTPFIKNVLQKQFEGLVDLDEIRIKNNNNTLYEIIRNKFYGKSSIAFVDLLNSENIIYANNGAELFNESNNLPGGIDQFNIKASGLTGKSGLMSIAHELGHIAQLKLFREKYGYSKGIEYMNKRRDEEEKLGKKAYISNDEGTAYFKADKYGLVLKPLSSESNFINKTMNERLISDKLYGEDLFGRKLPDSNNNAKATLDLYADVAGYIGNELMQKKVINSKYIFVENGRLRTRK